MIVGQGWLLAVLVFVIIPPCVVAVVTVWRWMFGILGQGCP